MLVLSLIDLATGKALHTEDYSLYGRHRILAITTPQKSHGVFKTTKFTTGGGTGSFTIAEPDGNGGIELTDLIISFEKKASAEVTIQFNDGSNSELIWFADMQDAPISLAANFTGNCMGWQSAYVEVVVAGAALDGSVYVGYIKHLKKGTLKYSDWNSRR